MRSVVLSLLLVGCVMGADVPAPGVFTAPQRIEVEPNWPGTVTVQNPEKLPTLILNLFDSKLQFRREYTDDPAVMQFFAFGREPGEYPIVFVVVKNSRPVEASRVIVVVKGKKDDDKKDDDKKDDDVKPPPIKEQSLGIIVIEETAQAANNRGMYFIDPALGQRITAKKHKWVSADKDVVDGNGQQPKDLARYLDMAKGKPLPYVFFIPASGGALIHQGPLPKTPAEMIELLKAKGG